MWICAGQRRVESGRQYVEAGAAIDAGIHSTSCLFASTLNPAAAAAAGAYRRILWVAEDPAAYKELKYAALTHITDTLQPAQEYHAALQKAQAAARQQDMQQRLQRPEIAAAVKAAKAAGGGAG